MGHLQKKIQSVKPAINLREAFGDWIDREDWQYFITLEPNVARLSEDRIRLLFKKFCKYLDRKVVGRNFWSKQYRRTVLVMQTEHPEYRPHLHALVQFRRERGREDRCAGVELAEAQGKVAWCWKKVCRGGSAHCESVRSKQASAGYLTKEWWKKTSYGKLILSTEFWPLEGLDNGLRGPINRWKARGRVEGNRDMPRRISCSADVKQALAGCLGVAQSRQRRVVKIKGPERMRNYVVYLPTWLEVKAVERELQGIPKSRHATVSYRMGV